MMPPAHAGPTENGKVHRWIVIAFIVAGVALCGGTCIGGFAIAERWVDYRPAAGELSAAERAYRAEGLPWTAKELAPKVSVKAEENAAPLIREAMEAAKKGKIRLNVDDAKLRTASRTHQWGEVEALLKPRLGVLAIFERAAKRPRADFGRDLDLGPNVLYSEFAEMRAATRLFGYRAQLRTSRGDLAGARSDVRTSLHLSRLAEADANLIALLVRIGGETTAYDAAQRTAAVDPRLARPLAEDLARPFPSPDLPRAFRGEAYMNVAMARNLSGRLSQSDLKEMARDGVPSSLGADPQHLVREGVPKGLVQRAYMARSLQIWTRVSLAGKKYGGDPVALGKAVDKISQAEEKKQGLSHLLNKILMPVFSQSGVAVARLRANREMTIAYLRAIEHRRRTGRFPATLIKGNDPFGLPYVSRLEGGGFRIYSVGANGKDEGGLVSAERAVGSKSDDVAVVFPPAVGKR